MSVQNDIANAATPAFHIDPPRIDPVERRAEIDQVIALATAAIPKAQMRRLGRLSFAPARDDDDHAYFGQIRSERIGKSGLEFRFPISARATGRRDLAITATELSAAAVRIARLAGKMKRFTAELRAIADGAMTAAKGGIAEMRLVAIGITPGDNADQVEVTVDVEMLGDDLKFGIERVFEHTQWVGTRLLEEGLKELAPRHVERRKILAQAIVAGAKGWIDDSAVRILDLSGVGLGMALELLRSERQVDFSFGGDDGYDLSGGVFWDNGIVRGYVEDRTPGNMFRLDAKVLTIKADLLPDTAKACLLGRRLGEVIDIKYVPGNALIVKVEESGGWLYLPLEIGRSVIRREPTWATTYQAADGRTLQRASDAMNPLGHEASTAQG